MSSSPSLAARAVQAILLLVGFYLFALSIVVLLVLLPWAEWHYAGRLHLKLAFFCLVGAGIVVWSILPRPDRFEAPGPLLKPEAEPALFEVVRQVAGATGQEMPAEVYLVPEVNAWVAQRGGVMGLGSRRVMGLGLPLLQLLSVPELKAVLAHEFGHYFGGDTRLGPWIYKTRAAIGRTLAGLSGNADFLKVPFELYGQFFLRISHAVSRAQELAADRLAARVAGAPALASGLKRIHGGAMAFHSYWTGEMAPTLGAGFLPGFSDGFRRFLGAAPVNAAMDRTVEKELLDTVGNPYDTHPPLAERLRALGADQPPAGAADAAVAAVAADAAEAAVPRAITLLRRPAELERALLEAMVGVNVLDVMKPLAWEEAGDRILLPTYQEAVKRHKEVLAGLRVGDLPRVVGALGSFASGVTLPGKETASDEEREDYAAWLLAAALAAALRREGWRLSSLPGEDVLLIRKERSIAPFVLLGALRAGEEAAALAAPDVARVPLVGRG